LPLADARQGLEMYLENMSAGKILLVANPQAVPLETAVAWPARERNGNSTAQPPEV